MLPAYIEAVLFDAGGTLVHIDYEFIRSAARGRGVEVALEALALGDGRARRAIDERSRRNGGLPGQDADRLAIYFEDLLRGAQVRDAEVPSLAQQLVAEHRRHNLWRVPLPGVNETLAGLRARGLRTAVVSNADGRAQALLDEVGISLHVELVIDSHFEGVEKPDPRIFELTLERLGVAASAAAYVGDIHAIDVVGARAAGLYPILIDPSGVYDGIDCPRVARLEQLLDPVPGAEYRET